MKLKLGPNLPYQISNSFGGRQVVGGSYVDFVESFGYPMKKSAKAQLFKARNKS
jgi:hypothetical protein